MLKVRWRLNIVAGRLASRRLTVRCSFSTQFSTKRFNTICWERLHRERISLEYYWLDRWYNVFRFSDPDGKLRNYYCNVNVPPQFDGRRSELRRSGSGHSGCTLTFLIRYLTWTTLKKMPDAILIRRKFSANARRALAELIELIESRSFPFND